MQIMVIQSDIKLQISAVSIIKASFKEIIKVKK